jgi:putative ABC transport system permease protein
MRFPRYFRLPWRTVDQIDREVEEELRFHLDMRVEELVGLGVPPAEARRRAESEFGDVEEAGASLRGTDARQEAATARAEWWDGLERDVRFAVRALWRSPGFTLVAVLTLALGIGAATSMFSVIRGVLLRPLPVEEQDRLAVIWMENPERGGMTEFPLGYRDLRAYRERTHAFGALAGIDYNTPAPSLLLDGGEPVTLAGTWVTGDFFPVLGVVPALGRALLPADDLPGAEPVMVISHGLWQRHFGGDPEVLGRRLRWQYRLHDRSYAIVGVLPEEFAYPQGAEFWTPVLPFFPAMLQEGGRPDAVTQLYPVGRLRPGVTVEQAAADFQAFLRDTDPERHPLMQGMGAAARSLPDLLVGDVRQPLVILSVAVLLVLLIACINVANLLFIRGAARFQELAIRSALGAGRGRIVRQLLTESALLAVVGGALGALLASWAVPPLVALAPPELPRLDAIRVDRAALAFAAAATALATLAAGLAPALWSATSRPAASLRGGTRVGGGSAGLRRVRQGLVVGQVALALLVLVGAGLLLRSLHRLQTVEMGFARERLVIAQMSLPPDRVAGREQHLDLVEEALERVRAVPGVAAATLVTTRPFSGTGGWDVPFYTGEGQGPEQGAGNPMLNLELAGPDFFSTLGVPLLRGRGFTEQDRGDAPLVAVINESTARATWPGEDPIGKRIKFGPLDGPAPWQTVVGVVADARYRDLVTPRASLYLPVRQFGGPVPMGIALRTSTDGTALVPAVREALREVDPALVLGNARTLDQLLAAPLARPRFSATLLGLFAGIALVLAAVGIYGVMATFVRQRTRDIGVRMALGARAGDVVRLVLRQGLGMAGAGAAIGLLAALLGTRALASILFEVRPTDPATLLGVAGLLLAVALLASYLPARRAARVDPIVALRAE